MTCSIKALLAAIYFLKPELVPGYRWEPSYLTSAYFESPCDLSPDSAACYRDRADRAERRAKEAEEHERQYREKVVAIVRACQKEEKE